MTATATTAGPADASEPAPADTAVGEVRPARAHGTVFLCVLLTGLVLLQRLAIPLGAADQVPLTLPLLLAFVVIGLRLNYLVISRSRAAFLGLALAALACMTLIAIARGLSPSVLSLLLFVLIYLPSICLAARSSAAAAALRFFVDLMMLAAAAGVVLFGLQFAGLGYVDYVAEVVPAQWLLTDYNTADPIRYGSPIFRSNGVIFLEPSFFSLLLGLAAAVSMGMRHRRGLLWLLLLGILASGAGNGVVVVAASALWLLLFGPDRRRVLVLVVPLLVAVVFAALTPLGSLFIERSAEVDSTNSSANQRFVQPYPLVLSAYASSPLSAAFGNGAGSSERFVGEAAPGVIVPAVPKLLYEYGVVGALCAGAFLLFVMMRDGLRTPWFAGLFLTYFFVNAALLLTLLAVVTYLFLSTLASGYAADGSQRTTQ